MHVIRHKYENFLRIKEKSAHPFSRKSSAQVNVCGVKIFPGSESGPGATWSTPRTCGPKTEGGGHAGCARPAPGRVHLRLWAEPLQHPVPSSCPACPPAWLHFDAMPVQEESQAAGCRGYKMQVCSLALQHFLAPGETTVGMPLLGPRGGASPQAGHLLLLNRYTGPVSSGCSHLDPDAWPSQDSTASHVTSGPFCSLIFQILLPSECELLSLSYLLPFF